VHELDAGGGETRQRELAAAAAQVVEGADLGVRQAALQRGRETRADEASPPVIRIRIKASGVNRRTGYDSRRMQKVRSRR
jgi:hypothetical protein